MDEWCDNEQKEDVFKTKICGKPVGCSKAEKIEYAAHKKAACKYSYDEVDLIKWYPVVSSLYVGSSFEKAFYGVSK